MLSNFIFILPPLKKIYLNSSYQAINLFVLPLIFVLFRIYSDYMLALNIYPRICLFLPRYISVLCENRRGLDHLTYIRD